MGRMTPPNEERKLWWNKVLLFWYYIEDVEVVMTLMLNISISSGKSSF